MEALASFFALFGVALRPAGPFLTTGSKHRNRAPFQDLWEQLLIDEASINRQIASCNQAVQQWGDGAPRDVLADLQERKRNIRRTKASLNKWLQQNPTVKKTAQLAIAEDLKHYPGCRPEYTLDQWDLYIHCDCYHNGTRIDESGLQQERGWQQERGVAHESSGEEESGEEPLADRDVDDSMDWSA
jgi:hypothetical protein